MLDVKAAEAAELLGVPVAQAEALLRHAGWNSERLMEGFWGDGERLSRAAGVEAWGSAAPPAGRGEITCRICFADCAPGETLAAPCGHRFCGDCYGQGRKRVIQRRFNVSVPRARVSETAPTLRERSEG
jgi:ariadne-1